MEDYGACVYMALPNDDFQMTGWTTSHTLDSAVFSLNHDFAPCLFGD